MKRNIGEVIGMITGSTTTFNACGGFNTTNLFSFMLTIIATFAACVIGGMFGILLQEASTLIFTQWNGKRTQSRQQL